MLQATSIKETVSGEAHPLASDIITL